MEFFMSLIFIGVSIGVYYFLYNTPLDSKISKIKKPVNRVKPFICVVPNSKCSDKMVTPDDTPLHLRRGWKKELRTYTGYYRTKYGAWKGKIVKRGDIFNVYIFDPPEEKLKNHSRWICFHHVKGKKWKIHLAINPKDKDIGAIIYYVENTIIESFKK